MKTLQLHPFPCVYQIAPDNFRCRIEPSLHPCKFESRVYSQRSNCDLRTANSRSHWSIAEIAIPIPIANASHVTMNGFILVLWGSKGSLELRIVSGLELNDFDGVWMSFWFLPCSISNWVSGSTQRWSFLKSSRLLISGRRREFQSEISRLCRWISALPEPCYSCHLAFLIPIYQLSSFCIGHRCFFQSIEIFSRIHVVMLKKWNDDITSTVKSNWMMQSHLAETGRSKKNIVKAMCVSEWK